MVFWLDRPAAGPGQVGSTNEQEATCYLEGKDI